MNREKEVKAYLEGKLSQAEKLLEGICIFFCAYGFQRERGSF